jgi:TldD protein
MIAFDGRLGRRGFLKVVGGSAGLLAAGHLERLIGMGEALAMPAFPLDQRAASRLLLEARSRGAGFADLYLETRTVTRMNLTDGAIQSVEQGVFAGGGVRAVDGDRTGYAYADSFEEGPLLDAAKNAAAIAATTSTSLRPISFRVETPPPTVRFQRSFESVTQDDRLAWTRRIDEAARAYDPAIKQVTIEYGDEMLHFAIANSDGLWVEDSLPLTMVRINVIADKQGRRGVGIERISHRLGAEQMDDDAPGKAATEAARMAVTMCDAAEAPAGEMPVILAAGGGVMFHEAVGHGLEGDYARRGSSFYSGRIGETVASDRVSIIDTGAMPDLRGSYNVDDEGTVPLKNLLIDRGVLRGFLTDRITAQIINAPRTGNARRQSYRFPPLVRMSNTYLERGEDPVEEIIKETGKGLYARTLGGGEVDTTSGNFTFGVLEGYLIENGRVTTPVRGANLVGSGPEIMRRIDRVGPDMRFWPGTCGKGQWVPVSSGAPTLRISSMTVGGSGQG